ncbi:MAG: high-potential iron-sulfur protein [Rubrivivax sp.]|nr:high-potential iron-sulfur protein [Rubrivivax sp.]
MTSRRQFIQIIPVAGAALVGARGAFAQAALVKEDDAQAKALGYVADAGKTDKAKYKQYAAGQACSNCALYQGKAADAAGGCALFPGKQVAGKGWCSAYAKKA